MATLAGPADGAPAVLIFSERIADYCRCHDMETGTPRLGLLRIILVLVCAGMASLCQAPNAIEGRFSDVHEVNSGFILNPLIFPDTGCLRDYSAAMKLDGIEKRKRIAEIVALKCVVDRQGVYYVGCPNMGRDRASIGVECAIILDLELTVLLSNRPPTNGDMENGINRGIIFRSEINPLSPRHMATSILEARKREKQKQQDKTKLIPEEPKSGAAPL